MSFFVDNMYIISDIHCFIISCMYSLQICLLSVPNVHKVAQFLEVQTITTRGKFAPT